MEKSFSFCRDYSIGALLLLSAVSFDASAADLQDDYSPWEAGFEFGFNSDGYEGYFTGAWFPVPNIGLKMSIGLASEIGDLAEQIMNSWNDNYYYEDDSEYYVTRFKFLPSMEFRTSPIIKVGDDGEGFLLFFNPGVCLSPGAAGSYRPQWFTWQLRGGVGLSIDSVVLSLGYSYSNFNLYSGWVPDYWGDYHNEPDHRTHYVFVSVAGRF